VYHISRFTQSDDIKKVQKFTAEKGLKKNYFFTKEHVSFWNHMSTTPYWP